MLLRYNVHVRSGGNPFFPRRSKCSTSILCLDRLSSPFRSTSTGERVRPNVTTYHSFPCRIPVVPPRRTSLSVIQFYRHSSIRRLAPSRSHSFDAVILYQFACGTAALTTLAVPTSSFVSGEDDFQLDACRRRLGTLLSLLPYLNFSVWFLSAFRVLPSGRSDKHRLLRHCAYGLLYALPALQLAAQPANSRSIGVALTAAALCPAHHLLEQVAHRGRGSVHHKDTRAAEEPSGSALPAGGIPPRDRRWARAGGEVKENSVTGDTGWEAQEEELQAARAWERRMEIRSMTVRGLRELARRRGVRGRAKMRKRDLVSALEASEGLGRSGV